MKMKKPSSRWLFLLDGLSGASVAGHVAIGLVSILFCGVMPDDLRFRLDPVNPVGSHGEVVGVREPGLAHLAGVVQLESNPDAVFRCLAPVARGVTCQHLLERFQVARTGASNDEFDVALSDVTVQHILDAIGQRETDHVLTFRWVCRGLRLYMIAYNIEFVNVKRYYLA